MSVTECRLPLGQAEVYAERLREALMPACDDILIVGSVRRRKVDVGDVELAILPKFDPASTDLFGGAVDERVPGYTHLDRAIASLVASDVLVRAGLDGPRQKAFTLGRAARDCGFKVELFIAQGRGNWGNTVAIRTGPTEMNIALVTAWNRGGLLPDFLCHRDGWLRWGGPGRSTVFECPTERHFFNYVKLPCIAPRKRTPEIVGVLRSGRYDVDELEAE